MSDTTTDANERMIRDLRNMAEIWAGAGGQAGPGAALWLYADGAALLIMLSRLMESAGPRGIKISKNFMAEVKR